MPSPYVYECICSSAHGQPLLWMAGCLRGAHHLIDHAAQQPTPHAAASVRCQSDHVGLAFAPRFEDAERRLLGATKFDAHGFAICLQPLCHRLGLTAAHVVKMHPGCATGQHAVVVGRCPPVPDEDDGGH